MDTPRLLVVCQDASLAESIRSAARDLAEVSVVQDEPSAMSAAGSGTWTMVLVDLQMAGCDTLAVLQGIRAHAPTAVRIAISIRTDRTSVAQALSVAQMFLPKPCPAEALRSQLARCRALYDRLRDPALTHMVAGLTRLPSAPTVYLALTQAMAKPEIGLRQIAEIVDCDPAVSAKVLQIVNSAYFGLAQPITAIHQAVLYLGVDMMRALALTAHVFSKEQITQLDGFSMPKLQQQATLCAHLASRLVEDNGIGDEAYAAGLLHDIGQIALAVGMPIKFAEAYRTARFRRQPLHVIEQELLGVTHAEVGACLLSSWGLPLPIVEGVSCQHAPSAAGTGPRPIVAALHLADALVTGAFNREDERTVTSRLDLPYLMQAGLGDDIPAWYQLAKEQLPQPGARRQIS